MVRRIQLIGRLARVEAALKVPLWLFRLVTGRPTSMPVKSVLAVLAEAMAIVYDPDGEHPPLSKNLLLLAQADDTAEPSVVGRSAIQLARQAREVKGP
ncbi:hypothetical protein ACWCQN_39915 [Streptomyces sp. NPDC001984]